MSRLGEWLCLSESKNDGIKLLYSLQNKGKLNLDGCGSRIGNKAFLSFFRNLQGIPGSIKSPLERRTCDGVLQLTG